MNRTHTTPFVFLPIGVQILNCKSDNVLLDKNMNAKVS
jgi:hypothetical protein